MKLMNSTQVKTYRAVLLSIAALVMLASFVAFLYHQSTSPTSEKSQVPAVTYQYCLREYEEKIGVFRVNDDKPFMTIDVYISTLPSVDQMDLKEGIYVEDDEKLRMIVEDYGS